VLGELELETGGWRRGVGDAGSDEALKAGRSVQSGRVRRSEWQSEEEGWKKHRSFMWGGRDSWGQQ